MAKDITSGKERVLFERFTNMAVNAHKEIGRAFFNFAYILKTIKDKGYFDVKYPNFKEYCEGELRIDWRTAYDYVKIADFVETNKEVIGKGKAEALGHKKLKLLSQKLSDIEAGVRKSILKKIDENESFTQIRDKIEKLLS